MKQKGMQRIESHRLRKEAVLRKEAAKYKDGLGRQRKIARDNEH